MAVSRIQRRPDDMPAGDPEARIAALIANHGASLQRTARHFSLCADDAHDAMQRALEIYLRRLADVDPATEGAWMKVVVRHEAMAVRRLRSESVAGDDPDLEAHEDHALRSVEDRLFGAERSARSAEALRRLKPDEAKALVLKAEGLSYAEIGDREGWTYTKVNRALTEGRRRFLSTYAELEAKDGCGTFGEDLAALAEGTASADLVLALRPHLRHCPACRATLRELRGGRRRVASWLPWPAWLWVVERRQGSDAADVRTPVLDAATNAAEAGASAGSGTSVGRLTEFKLRLQDGLHRFTSSDLATSTQIAASSGGGRATGVAALIGFCLSGVGAGTYCVATFVLPSDPPKPDIRREAVKRPESRPASRPKEEPSARIISVAARATPTPVSTPAPVRRKRRAPVKSSPPASTSTSASGGGSGSTRSWEAPPPPSPAPAGQQEFAFESSAGGSAEPPPAAPAAAPPTGGGEFAP